MKAKITPEEYSSILKSLELDDISLTEGAIKVFECSRNGGTIDLNFKDKYSFSELNNKVFFLASFKIDGILGEEDNKEKLFSMSGEFKIAYTKTKDITVTKDFFDVFKETSLIVFVWPYFREFIQNTLVRSGFPPLTLPMRVFGHSK